MGGTPIPGWWDALFAACVAAAFYTAIGLALARTLAVSGIAAIGLAPALGWAVFNAVALPVLTLTGFGTLTAKAVCALALVCAAVWLRRPARTALALHSSASRLPPAPSLPLWALALAGGVALLPLIAIMPKPDAGGILLGPPMFDHVKVAIVDAVLRQGLPVHNPFMGDDGPSPLAYYYLWHFGTAVLAACLGIGGWAAEAAMTGFTAWASLLLMMAVAVAVSGRNLACAAVALLAIPASMRPVLDAWLGDDLSGRMLLRGSDIAGWLDQAAWVPQHLASACCVVLAVVLMPGLAGPRPRLTALALGLVVAAGFQSSTWVGGVAFAVAGPVAGMVTLLHLRPARVQPGWNIRRPSARPALDTSGDFDWPLEVQSVRAASGRFDGAPGVRWQFLGWAAASALLAGVLVSPFILAQLHAVSLRHGGPAVAVSVYRTLGPIVGGGWRGILDVPAFWLVALPFGLPAIMPLAMAGLPRGPAAAGWQGTRPLIALALACMAAAWVCRSTIDNNDLGWRAMLPPVLILTALAACALVRLLAARRFVWLAAAFGLIAAGLPHAWLLADGYVTGQRPGAAIAFAGSLPAWDAVRQVAAPGERVANNPTLAAAATPWPVNITWALLSDRPSCYAQWETVLAYGAVAKPDLVMMNATVQRAFDGRATPGDIATLARQYDCRVVLVQPTDGAWQHDAFAASPDYKLAGAQAERWRIYQRQQPLPVLQ